MFSKTLYLQSHNSHVSPQAHIHLTSSHISPQLTCPQTQAPSCANPNTLKDNLATRTHFHNSHTSYKLTQTSIHTFSQTRTPSHVFLSTLMSKHTHNSPVSSQSHDLSITYIHTRSLNLCAFALIHPHTLTQTL